jgi:hypothetical protein
MASIRLILILLLLVHFGQSQETLQSDQSMLFNFCAFTTFLDIQRSGRLIADILEIFAPAQSDSTQKQRLPYGINRRMTEEERLGVQSSPKTG